MAPSKNGHSDQNGSHARFIIKAPVIAGWNGCLMTALLVGIDQAVATSSTVPGSTASARRPALSAIEVEQFEAVGRRRIHEQAGDDSETGESWLHAAREVSLRERVKAEA